ncbi:MAG: transposase [Microgenomates group bacterium]
MPKRKIPLVNGEIYHIFNRSIAKIPILDKKRAFDRFLEIVDYYRFTHPPVRFSYFLRMPQTKRSALINSLAANNDVDMEILAFGIMTNHFHFLLRQTKDNGISKFVGLIQNSFAKYFNLITQRTGSVFQQAFKSVRIESERQFIHTARYIHLNPITDFVINKPQELVYSNQTSLLDYTSDKPRPFLNTKLLLSHFPSKERLKQYTLDQVDYQRTLAQIKHLINE